VIVGTNVNKNIMYKELKAFYDSEGGQKHIKEYYKKLELERKIHNKQLRRLKKENFISFLEKVIKKYESKSYQDRYWKRGLEPPNDLYFFIEDWVSKYGRNCSIKEWKKYMTPFTTRLFYFKGYYISRLDGQGSFIKIEKKNGI